jgi:predicted MFS family arabinose efflux permease
MAGTMISGVIADAVGYAGLFALGTALSLAGIVLAMHQIPREHETFRSS